MESILNSTFLLIVFATVCLANFKIDTSIPFCIQTDEIVDLDSCVQEQELLKKIICAAEINELKTNRDQYNNEFRYVFTLNEKKLFFFLNRNIYNTKCSKIDSFDIHDKVDSCTKDVLVSFKKDGITHNGYLTKEEIIRTDSVPSECKDEIFLSMDNNRFDLIRKDKKIEIVEQATKVPGNSKMKIETEISMEDKSFLQNLLTLYQKIEFSPYVQMSKDLTLTIVLISLIIIIIVFCAKNKKKNLLRLIQSVINIYFSKERIVNVEAAAKEKIVTLNKYKKQPIIDDITYIDERPNLRNPKDTANGNNDNKQIVVSKKITAPKKEKRVSAFSGPVRDTLCRLCGSYYTKKGLANHQIACAKRLLNKSQ